jgi:DNA-binding LacI/PurR family transcriptional regulator
MIELQNRKGLAKYLQVRDIIHAKIQSHEYAPGSPIPSESELVNMFGVARMTVRQALAELEREGMLRREQGRGTFVESPRCDSSRIVVLMPGRQTRMITDSSLYKLMVGAMEEAHELNLELSCFPLALYRQETQQNSDCNYIFPWPSDENTDFLYELAGQGKNVVVINRIFRDKPNVTYFSTDHYLSGKMATAKMLARGHRKIGLVTMPAQDVRFRADGYRDAMAEAGLEVKPEYICLWNRDLDNSQFTPLLNSGATAIFVTQGFLLPYLMRCLDDQRLNVPQDFDIIAFNRIQDGASYKPYVHEVIEPFREMASFAVRRCFENSADSEIGSCLFKTNIVMKNK